MPTAIVEYNLREYLTVILEVLPLAKAARKENVPFWATQTPAARIGMMDKIVAVPFATLAFLWKKHRIGTCTFSFDCEGIRRISRARELFVRWPEIKAVTRLSNAYLLTKANGSMPLPYRCLSIADRNALERLLAAAGHPCS